MPRAQEVLRQYSLSRFFTLMHSLTTATGDGGAFLSPADCGVRDNSGSDPGTVSWSPLHPGPGVRFMPTAWEGLGGAAREAGGSSVSAALIYCQGSQIHWACRGRSSGHRHKSLLLWHRRPGCYPGQAASLLRALLCPGAGVPTSFSKGIATGSRGCTATAEGRLGKTACPSPASRGSGRESSPDWSEGCSEQGHH